MLVRIAALYRYPVKGLSAARFFGKPHGSRNHPPLFWEPPTLCRRRSQQADPFRCRSIY